MARGTTCAAHVHPSTIPQERHHVTPLSRGGPNTQANLVLICCNAHSDVHYLLDAIEKARGYDGVPLSVRRSFGPGVRAIARRGWAAYAEAFLSGALAREAELWTSDGQPRDPAVPSFAAAVATIERQSRGVGLPDAFLAWDRERRRSLPPTHG